MLTSTAFAGPMTHDLSHLNSMMKPQQLGQLAGSWKGQCQGVDADVVIEQTGYTVTFHFHSQNPDYTSTQSYILNGSETTTRTIDDYSETDIYQTRWDEQTTQLIIHTTFNYRLKESNNLPYYFTASAKDVLKLEGKTLTWDSLVNKSNTQEEDGGSSNLHCVYHIE